MESKYIDIWIVRWRGSEDHYEHVEGYASLDLANRRRLQILDEKDTTSSVTKIQVRMN